MCNIEQKEAETVNLIEERKKRICLFNELYNETIKIIKKLEAKE